MSHSPENFDEIQKWLFNSNTGIFLAGDELKKKETPTWEGKLNNLF